VIRLSAFADEISPRLDEQIAVLRDENIPFLDLRSVDDVNVLDLTDHQVDTIKRALADSGLQVAAIGSPIGKVPIDSTFDEHMERFERALALATQLETPFVRIFSFYGPEREPSVAPADYRDEVLTRLRTMTARARAEGIILLHENEKGIYGDTIERCVDLFRSIDDPYLQAAFDPANFIQCGETPYPAAYDAIQPWIRSVHVKDASADGEVVPAGEGVARWSEIVGRLGADGYDGFFALEPHLSSSGQYGGFSGPDRFRRASHALKQILDEVDWECIL
jgi:sugar phosphate isomerase/epimerase